MITHSGSALGAKEDTKRKETNLWFQRDHSLMERSGLDFPGGAVIKNTPASAGNVGLIPGSERSSGVGNGNPLQYSCLENSNGNELVGLQSTGLQRVGHDWACIHTCKELYTRQNELSSKKSKNLNAQGAATKEEITARWGNKHDYTQIVWAGS